MTDPDPTKNERIARLIAQVQAMVDQSGNPEHFDAAAWLSRWLREPLPALGGGHAIDLLDTAEGELQVSRLLAQIQSGSYA